MGVVPHSMTAFAAEVVKDCVFSDVLVSTSLGADSGLGLWTLGKGGRGRVSEVTVVRKTVGLTTSNVNVKGSVWLSEDCNWSAAAERAPLASLGAYLVGILSFWRSILRMDGLSLDVIIQIPILQ